MTKDEAWEMIDSALEHSYSEKDVIAIKEALVQPLNNHEYLTDNEIVALGRREKNELMDFIYENGCISEGREYYFMKYAKAILAAEKLKGLNK